MKQIVVALEGGLGNQMFQYAAGRALALRTGGPLVLDMRPLLRHGQRSYGLGDFQLGAGLELLTAGSPLRIGGLRRFFRQLTGGEQTFREAGFAYDERIRSAAAPIRLEGYFQSERYFADAAFRRFATSARTAILGCGNIPISAERYNIFKEITMNFSPQGRIN